MSCKVFGRRMLVLLFVLVQEAKNSNSLHQPLDLKNSSANLLPRSAEGVRTDSR
jgi:hypothetical protein